MSVETVAFIPMNEIVSTAEFVQSLKNSINEMVKESYLEHDIGRLYNSRIPFVLNQAKIRNFEYDVVGGREHMRATFSVFVDVDEFNIKNAHQTFELPDNTLIHTENEARMLYIFSNVHDHSEVLEAPKMVVQLGKWGRSREIIQRVMNDFGVDYYFTADDCAEDFELVSANPNKEMA